MKKDDERKKATPACMCVASILFRNHLLLESLHRRTMLMLPMKNVVPCPFGFVLLLLALAPVAVNAATEANGWDLTKACEPIGQVSTATYNYKVESGETALLKLTVEWEDGTAQTQEAEMGSNEPPATTQVVFTHTYQNEGTYDTNFTAVFNSQRITRRSICGLESNTDRGSPTSAAGFDWMRMTRKAVLNGVLFGFLVLAYTWV